MSRIYEALKRASEGPTIEPWDDSPAGERAPSESADASVLEQYPREPTKAPDPLGLRAAMESDPSAREKTEALHVPPPTRPRIAAVRRSVNPSFEGRLVSSPEVAPSVVEQYRQLADVLQEIQDRSVWGGRAARERSLRTVLVTSALPGEGKTLTLVNLALTMSSTHQRRVLIIDGCLHGPAVHDVLALPNTGGLSDILRSGAQPPQFQQIAPLLSVLPAGRPEDISLRDLTSDRMRALLDVCAQQFDWVFLDAAAVSLLPDPGALARFIRAVLFVVGCGSTPYTTAERAIAQLGRGCVIGTVLNRMEVG